MELPFDPVTPLLGVYPKKLETPIQKNLCTPMFIEVLFTIMLPAKCCKQPKCPSVNEWIKKLWYIYKWNTARQKERRNSYPSDSMDRTGEHYAK